MASSEARCPRCNTLKVVGCTGSCLLCKSTCKTDGPTPAPPSREARDDDEHPGTPLER
jgi:hypothetical protein